MVAADSLDRRLTQLSQQCLSAQVITMATFVTASSDAAKNGDPTAATGRSSDADGVFVHHCVRPRWVADKATKTCQGTCSRKFGFTVRRHHCRGCGKVFCAKCAPGKQPLPHLGYGAPVRCCVGCAAAAGDGAATAGRRAPADGTADADASTVLAGFADAYLAEADAGRPDPASAADVTRAFTGTYVLDLERSDPIGTMLKLVGVPKIGCMAANKARQKQVWAPTDGGVTLELKTKFRNEKKAYVFGERMDETRGAMSWPIEMRAQGRGLVRVDHPMTVADGKKPPKAMASWEGSLTVYTMEGPDTLQAFSMMRKGGKTVLGMRRYFDRVAAK